MLGNHCQKGKQHTILFKKKKREARRCRRWCCVECLFSFILIIFYFDESQKVALLWIPFFLLLLNWTLASIVVFVVKNQIRADNPWFFLPFKPRVKFSRNWNHCNSKLYDNSYLLIKTLYRHLRASWKEQPAKCLKTFVLSFDRLIKSDFLYREMQLSLCIQSTESGLVRHHQLLLLLPLVLV